MTPKTFTIQPVTYFALIFWHNGRLDAYPEKYGNVCGDRTADYAYMLLAGRAERNAFDNNGNPLPCPHCEMRKVRVVNGRTKVGSYRQDKFAAMMQKIWCENVPPHHPDHKQAT